MKRNEQFGLAFAAVVALALAAGCAASPSGKNGADGGAADVVLPDAAPSVWTGGPSADLFAVDHVPQFEFTLSDAQWKWLQENARKEEFVPAEATYEGRPAGLVGLRFKGNRGTLLNCFDATGKLTCAKLSFKVDFGEYDQTNRFFGLKKINLHSMINDPTKLHEKLSYDLFRLSDIHAPRSSWANVKVNGVSYGLFSMVEEVDGRFTQDRWPGNGDGNLYKEAWPHSTASSSYVQKLETNKAVADTTAIASFATELAAASPDGLAATLAKWTDVAALHRYMAVDDAIFNCDGVTALYVGGATSQAWGNHNYYLYQEEVRNIFWLVPWDLDATLFTCTPFSAVPPWNTTPADCDKNYGVWGGAWVKPPGCDRVFQGLAQDSAGYQAAVDALLAGPFATERLTAEIDRWADFIRASEAADPTAGGEAAWMATVNQLKGTIPVLRERAVAMRDRKFPAPVALALDRLNDFEQASPLAVALGIQAVANPNTEIAVTLNGTAPLGGLKELRTEFVYRDPGPLPQQAYGQWIYLVLPFAGGSHDLSGAKSIRMVLRADHPRTVRIDLESSVYMAPTLGIKFGWEVPVMTTPTTVDLLLSSAAVPIWASVRTDVLGTVLQQVNGVAFNPAPLGRGPGGYLGPGITDPGFLEIDDVQIVSGP